LLSHPGFARSACLCDVASGDCDARSGFSSPMGSPQANRALDDPNLAVRLGHRRVCVFYALQMVSSWSVMQAILPATSQAQTGSSGPHAKSCTWRLFDV